MYGLIEQGSLGDVAFCLTYDPDSIDRPHSGLTPLMISAMLGRTRMVRLLLNRGADSNLRSRDLDGVTALHLAASAGVIGAAKELLGNFSKT